MDLTPMPGVSLRGPAWATEEQAITEPATIAALKSKLDKSDRDVAFKALEIALMQLGDGATLVWKRQKNGLSGVIKTISAFRDDQGRVCRKVNYSITLGTYERAVVGTACRGKDGNWSLDG
ncbi:RT0821/Lpp0805 family surface protein [Methyloligella halotolerans]|uniref:RT0821/Lpp0805 family surface protein n=1 Tax=Methyloligella halotolerans TaxID=1177755 RepID=UPI00083E4F4C|nr:RT0821/Lpp0805 family surface protein [Methyloligella halotolerans]